MNHQPNRFLTAIRNRPLVSMLALVLILAAGVIGVFLEAKDTAREHVEALLDRTSEGHKHHLDLLLGRSLLIPEVLATSRTVQALLLQPDATSAAEENRILEETARNVHVDAIYVMDLSGKALAASNWRESGSFVGHNYGFRPYFQQAVAGRTGRYIAKGVTSLRVGYYLARPVLVDGRVRGAVAVKVSFDAVQSRVEELWRQGREIALVADEQGVVSVSPLSGLMFKTMRPLPEAVRKEIETSRQYGEQITPASLTVGHSLSERIRFVEFKDVPDQSFLQKSYYFQDIDMRLYLHVPASLYWESVTDFTAMFSLAALAIFLATVALFQRWTYAAKLLEAAIRDPLTGLNTRLYMKSWCDAAIRTHNRDPRSGFGLAVFDLDHFKQINDTYGHLAGDAVLAQVGEIIRNAIRGEDLAVRFGGEELAVFVRCTDQAVAAALAERIRHSVEQTGFQSKIGRMPVTLSGGVAFHGIGETFDALIARADKKLYEAKKLGRNRICS